MSLESEKNLESQQAETTPVTTEAAPAAPAPGAAPAGTDIDAEVARRVKIEKEKLYQSVEDEKKKAATLAKELEEFKKKDADAQAKAEEERKAKLTAEQKLQEELEQTKLKVEQFQTGLELFKKESAEEIRKRDLALFKEKIVAGKSDYIPELVTGDTEEAIQASFEASQKRFKELVAQVATPAKPDPALQTEVRAPVAPAAQQQQAAGTKSAADVMSMTPEEYKAYKDSVLSKYNF